MTQEGPRHAVSKFSRTISMKVIEYNKKYKSAAEGEKLKTIS